MDVHNDINQSDICTLLEALRLLGIDERRARELGIDIYKVGMVWPLETRAPIGFIKQ